ncbi:MAG: outer membrane beta-barrel protein, partial [Bacilli bacterium]|nr:outer membrane beta-barrel protein [Bacilli bacterium]
MKKIILLIESLLVTLISDAQTFIGCVIDEQFQPIAFANVVLLNRTDSTYVSGTITREDGTFSIESSENKGLLKVSSVGYITKYVDVNQENLGDIHMQPDTQILGEITVKGYRPIVKQEEEKTIFNIKHMPKIEALKAMDVVKYAPGVVVTSNGSIQVAGKPAAVFVNNRQIVGDELVAYMNMLKASDIDRIEVLQNHGGVNDASIQGGVLNIITKRNIVGFNGSTDIYASSPGSHYYDLTPTTNIFFGTDKWNLYGTYSYTQRKAEQYSETTNDYLHNNTLHYSEGNYFSSKKRHTYRLGAVYNLSVKHSLGVEINGITTPPTTSQSNYTQNYQAVDGNKYIGSSKTTYNSHSDYYNIVGSYRWDIDGNKSYLNCLINYNNKKSNTNNLLETTYIGTTEYDVNERDITNSDGSNISTTIDLRKNYHKGWSLRAGGKFLTSERSSYLTVIDQLGVAPSTSDWNYRENICGGYLGTSKSIGNLYLYFSLRAENTDVSGKSKGCDNTSKNYTDWFPYFYVSYDTSQKYGYSLSYNRTIYRPAFSLMNGYINRVSDVLYDKGNPELQAELTDVLGLTMSHERHSASLKYRHTNKAITELFEVKDGITYHTNVNYGTISSITLDYSYSGNLFAWWQSNFYLAGSYTRIPNSYNKKELFGTLISWNNRMTWEKVGSLSTGFFYTSPTIVGNSYQKGYASLDISFERSFFNNAITLQAGVDDLLNCSKIRATNVVPTLNYSIYMKNQTQQVWCRLSYNFSTKTKTNKNKIKNDNDIMDRM